MKQSYRGTNKGTLFAVIILSAFLFLTFIFIYSYHLSVEHHTDAVNSPLIKYHIYLMISMAGLGVAVGATVFYFMSRKVDEQQHSAQSNAQVVMRFLSGEERLVVNTILLRGGKILQSELSRQPGMNRVKAHRTLARLSSREVVELGSYGKTRIVTLKPEIYESLRADN
jgi:uncharacterized membrane protein